MSNGDLNWITNFSWGIADDVLRDIYVRGKYRDVILPMTVVRRLDAVVDGDESCRGVPLVHEIGTRCIRDRDEREAEPGSGVVERDLHATASPGAKRVLDVYVRENACACEPSGNARSSFHERRTARKFSAITRSPSTST